MNSIQIRSGRISDAETFFCSARPRRKTIPQQLTQSTVTGQWDFDFGDLGAEHRSNLQYFDPTFGILSWSGRHERRQDGLRHRDGPWTSGHRR
ncbi:MAG: hypothetical protein KIT22_04955 [Verrucomicrobiae bacterium]|nr:hypothetical protein [Verrucomicrobiae bacterium]